MRKNCPVCHHNFEARRSSTTYCSKKCKGLGTRKRIIVKCEGCGKYFEKLPYLQRSADYCSLACYHLTTSRRQLKTCIKCHKEFKAKRYLVEQGYGQYCSRRCQHLDYPEKVVLKCKQCGKAITKPPSVAKLTQYCSKECQDLGMSEFEIHVCAQCKNEFKIPMWEVRNGKGKFCSRDCFNKYVGESSLEEKVRHYLEDHKIIFIQEKKFGRYRADFYIENLKLIIECDGEYWHLCRHTEARDARKTKFLESLGYHVARLTGRQINEHWPDCIKEVFSE